MTTPVRHANYELAANWTPTKAGKLVFDTTVNPHWLELSDRFWYSYETSSGRNFYLVDPRARSRKLLFDNAKMAAQLTRISLYPYDAQHLPIRTIKFIKKDTAIQFEIDYPKDSLIKDGDKVESVSDLDKATKDQDMTDKSKKTDAAKVPESKTKTLYFNYDLATGELSLDAAFKPPLKKPRWANLSPDEKTVLFARGFNLFMMDAANYALAQKKADDKNIREIQLTTDGEDHYSFSTRLRDDQKKEYQDAEKDRKDYRVPATGIVWSKDSKKFVVDRTDERKVADLSWVINLAG